MLRSPKEPHKCATTSLPLTDLSPLSVAIDAALLTELVKQEQTISKEEAAIARVALCLFAPAANRRDRQSLPGDGFALPSEALPPLL